jgi:hypothetical protein
MATRIDFKGEDTIYPYGKYQGKTLKEIYDIDIDYFLWLKDTCTIDKLKSIAQDMSVVYYDEIEKYTTDKNNKLISIPSLTPNEIHKVEILFVKNLTVFYDDYRVEKFAYYKQYEPSGLIYNVIFAKGTYKKAEYGGYEYVLPMIGNVGKRIKGHYVVLEVEARTPYFNKKGNHLVQNLIVKNFIIK